MKILDDGGQAARVVVMSVGQHHYVELANGARPEIRRYDVFADIEARLGGAAEGQDSAAVDQHELGIREGNQ